MSVTCVLPVSRPTLALATLAGVLNQDWPAERVLVIDVCATPLADDDVMAYFCATCGYEIVRYGPTPIAVVLARIPSLPLRQTDAVWLLNDDVIPLRDCLGVLRGVAASERAGFVAGRKVEIMAAAFPWGSDGWNRANYDAPHPIQVPFADGANVLIDLAAWRAVPPYAPVQDGRGGEDLLLTAQIGAARGGIYAPDARAYHLRTEAAGWQRDPIDRAWLDAHLAPLLDANAYADFLQAIGQRAGRGSA